MMSESNLTEGVENTPSALPGEKSPVLLGLNGNAPNYLKQMFVPI